MPRAEGVVQKEVHHVVLGEKLRDGRQFISADLVARGVDLVFAVRLPKLINPAEAVGRHEHITGQIVEHVLQFRARLRWKCDLQHRISAAENLREHGLGISTGEG